MKLITEAKYDELSDYAYENYCEDGGFSEPDLHFDEEFIHRYVCFILDCKDFEILDRRDFEVV